MNNFTLDLVKQLIKTNNDSINSTAIKNCHALGLNSFIINHIPKIRLFIADDDCELFEKFDPLNPKIPIHAHKYNDLFMQLEGELIHHFYNIGTDIKFNKYRYYRLSDKEQTIQNIGCEYLKYRGEKHDVVELKSSILHSVSLSGEKCSWIIIELDKDENFEQVSYHQNLVNNPELYKRFDDPINYLNQYFKSYKS